MIYSICDNKIINIGAPETLFIFYIKFQILKYYPI